MAKFEITTSEYEAAKKELERNRRKSLERRLRVILMRYEGMSCKQISEALGYDRSYVSYLCREFKQKGLAEYVRPKKGGNHRSLSCAEEDAILAGFQAKAEAGQRVTIPEIKAAFDQAIGKNTGRGYIYMVLKRKGWRQVAPGVEVPQGAVLKEEQTTGS